ncbi:nucleotidyl transferase AbiEii/AbiGii toxin family protein [Deinococcus sp. D7000]|nr:nucleotidyl transferase AbiEii/AbiGii toxin family protein [Deinococcus sp. D7000]
MRMLPLLRDHPALALKGGTAINLFVQHLSRPSVDIDLAYTDRRGVGRGAGKHSRRAAGGAGKAGTTRSGHAAAGHGRLSQAGEGR